MKEQWNDLSLKNAFRQTPPAFTAGVEDTLRRLQMEKEDEPMKKKMPLALMIALIIMTLLLGVACAASLSPTIDLFGWFYGDDFKSKLEQGDVAPVHQTYTLGDLTYTLDDVVYADGVLYGSGTIAVSEGKEAVLMTEDYEVTEPAGYMLHYGDEEIPKDAPTYAQLAKEKGCKILLGKLVPDGYMVGDELSTGDIGYCLLPQQDGTIQFTFEIYAGPDDATATVLPEEPDVKGIDRSETYTLNLYVGNWEVTQDGEWLREEPNNTWLKENWVVTVVPETR